MKPVIPDYDWIIFGVRVRKTKISDLAWHRYWEGIRNWKSQKVCGNKAGTLTGKPVILLKNEEL